MKWSSPFAFNETECLHIFSIHISSSFYQSFNNNFVFRLMKRSFALSIIKILNYLSFKLTLAPASIKILTILTNPFSEAIRRGVHPSLRIKETRYPSFVFTSASCSINNSTISTKPFSDALYSGVHSPLNMN